MGRHLVHRLAQQNTHPHPERVPRLQFRRRTPAVDASCQLGERAGGETVAEQYAESGGCGGGVYADEGVRGAGGLDAAFEIGFGVFGADWVVVEEACGSCAQVFGKVACCELGGLCWI